MSVSAALQTWPCALTYGDVEIAKIWDGIAVLAPPNMFGFAVVWSGGLDHRGRGHFHPIPALATAVDDHYAYSSPGGSGTWGS